jgi:hypothetical protein
MRESEMRQFMARRSDGPWELLATAVDDPHSMRRSRQCLSREEIQQGAAGLAISPAIIDDRIQAVAACGATRVAALVQDWHPAQQLADANPMAAETDFWTAAWLSALRFLPALPDVDASMIPRLPIPIRSEIEVLSSRAVIADVFELMEWLNRTVTYDELRIAGSSAIIDAALSADIVSQLVRDAGGAANLERLRAVAGSVRFERSAIEWMEDAFRTTSVFVSEPQSGPSGGELVLAQLVYRNSSNAGLLGKGRDEIVRKIEQDGPRLWARLAYLMVGTQWTCP